MLRELWLSNCFLTLSDRCIFHFQDYYMYEDDLVGSFVGSFKFLQLASMDVTWHVTMGICMRILELYAAELTYS